MADVALPELCGSRALAQTLLGTLPADLTGVTVTVDASATAATAQGFADELVRELLGERTAGFLIVTGPRARMAGHVRLAARLRGHLDRLDLQGIRP